jgi:hypothetical protein
MAVVSLGWIGYHFTVRTLRFVTFAFAAVVVVLVTRYGVVHQSGASADFVSAFIRGVDDLGVAFFQPLLPGHGVPVPGRWGWLVIVAILAFAYRELEVWAMRWQPPAVDTSALGGGQSRAQKNSAPTGGTSALGGGQPGAQENSAPSAPGGGGSDEQRVRDKLAAELRFRLPAVEVRAPPILPGGTMPNGLASIAEDSGVAGGGLAGAIIRVAGLLWPTPRRYRARVWVKLAVASMTVTVDIADARTGGSIATKTLAAGDVDDAADRAAAYVARQIFKEDPTVPPWSVGSFDGSDLAALLCAKQEQEIIDFPDQAHQARRGQIIKLKNAVCNSPGAGVARYELALLDDLEGCHPEALSLHAINRVQYQHFFRGRYRLGMSLEMIANPDYQPWNKEAAKKLCESLGILDGCGVTCEGERGISEEKLSPEIRQQLLGRAMKELWACQQQLTLWHLTWEAFWHRDERAIRKPYRRLVERQRFQDGCRVAELLVAVRHCLTEKECSHRDGDWRLSWMKRRSLKRAMYITSIITGDITAIEEFLGPGETRWLPWLRRKKWPAGPNAGITRWLPWLRRKKWPWGPNAGKTRWLPWQHRTPSWQAAYNAACLYAALHAACTDESQQSRIAMMARRCLDRVVNDRFCEMERPWDWISTDPDLRCLKDKSREFRKFLDD